MDRAEALTRARSWWSAVADTSYVPMSSHDAQAMLADLIGNLASALDAEHFDPTVAADAGSALVAMRLTNPTVLARSANTLVGLPARLSHGVTPDNWRSTYGSMLGAFGHGYAAALQRQTLADQESLQRAMATARQNSQDALHASETRFRVVFENAAVAIAIADIEARLIDVNPALLDMLGNEVDALRGRPLLDVLHPEDQPGVRDQIDALVDSGEGTVRVETRFRRGDGSDGWALFAITLVRGVGEQKDYLLAAGEDVTERRLLQAQLYQQSRHDPLTGLPNRLLLAETLQAAIAAADEGDRVGLCFLDLDGFKEINDKYGHGTGDRLLTAVAHRLGSHANSNGHMVARLGGDEFIAVVPAPADPADVVTAAHGLLAALADPVAVDGEVLGVSASIGVVVPRLFGAHPDTLLAAADFALYRAKADGGGALVLHEHDQTFHHQPGGTDAAL